MNRLMIISRLLQLIVRAMPSSSRKMPKRTDDDISTSPENHKNEDIGFSEKEHVNLLVFFEKENMHGAYGLPRFFNCPLLNMDL